MKSRTKSISKRQGCTDLSSLTRISFWRKYGVPIAIILLGGFSVHLYRGLFFDDSAILVNGSFDDSLTARADNTSLVDATERKSEPINESLPAHDNDTPRTPQIGSTINRNSKSFNDSLTVHDNGDDRQKDAVKFVVLATEEEDDDDDIPSPNATAAVAPPPQRHVSQTYLKYLQGLEPFPKKLHILFPHKDFYKREPPLPFVKNGILRFMELNPSWNVTVHDDADMDRVITRAADDGIISEEEKTILVGFANQTGAHPVERSDIARLLIIWYEGGMYYDVDSLVNVKDLSQVFGPTIKMCLPIYTDVNFAQSATCSSPKNQVYIEMIQQMSEHRMKSNKGGGIERRGGWAKASALFSMGPPIFNRIMFKMVFDETRTGDGTIPGMEEHMRWLQEEAGEIIATGQFKDQCHSFIADPFEGCKHQDRSELYGLYNMSRWGQAVAAKWNASSST